MPDSEPSCEPSVIESLNPSSEAVLNEDTLQNNPTLLKDKLKQFEVDNFVKKLMKVCIYVRMNYLLRCLCVCEGVGVYNFKFTVA